MLEKLEAIEITEMQKNFFTNSKFKHKISSESNKSAYPKCVWFLGEYIYDENQNGSENTKYGYWSNIYIGCYAFKADSNSYSGKFNSDYTEFTYSSKTNLGTGITESEIGKWIFEKPVADSADKVSMQAKKSGSSEEVTLQFSCICFNLFGSPDRQKSGDLKS